MTRVVPCAGVSACFSRRAIAALRAERAGEVFSITSLTEDYDIAFRLSRMGMREIFVKFPIGVIVNERGEAGTIKRRLQWLPVATREYFPSDFRAAYRQRARWLLGIAFQGWSQHGWEGSIGEKYFLLRDRKGLVTAPAAIAAYFVMLNLVALEMVFPNLPDSERPPLVLLNTEAYQLILAVNLILLANRIVQRSFFTGRLYGPMQGLMAGPRMIVSNLLNFFATARAVSVYMRHRLTGAPIVWDKTTHTYPSSAELS
jgi:adsorption protein B